MPVQHRLLTPIFVSSQVVTGFGRGSKKLGCPTANLEDDVVQGLTLDDGIYYGFAQLVHPPKSSLDERQCDEVVNNCAAASSTAADSKDSPIILDTSPHNPIYPMVASLGWNPHFNNTNRTLEVHILHHFGYDFYGSLIRVALCGYIRPEMKFESMDGLIGQIRADCEFARNALLEPKKVWSKVITDRFFHI